MICKWCGETFTFDHGDIVWNDRQYDRDIYVQCPHCHERNVIQQMDETIRTYTIESWNVGVGCIVCGETIVLGQYSFIHAPIKMCEKCKRAILHIRNQIELTDEDRNSKKSK